MNVFKRLFKTGALVLAAAASMSPLHAVQIAFDAEDSGTVITTSTDSQRYLDSLGLRITPTGNDGGNTATIYDSTAIAGEDPDLERGTGWTDGNAGDIDAGGLLILQEYITPEELANGHLTSQRGQSDPNGTTPEGFGNGSSENGSRNAPDDGGAGGTLLLEFEDYLSEFQILLADIQFPGVDAGPAGQSPEDSGARLTFRDVTRTLDSSGNVTSRVVNSERIFYLNSTTEPDWSFEDRSLNLTQNFTREVLGFPADSNGFNEVDVNFGSNSGGISFVNYELTDREANLAIGSSVFIDANGSGSQDASDPGIAGVVVNLVDGAENGNIIATTTTDSEGLYLFSGITAGDYIVRIPAGEFGPGRPLEGFTSLPNRTDADNNIDGNDDGIPLTSGAVRSPVITLSQNDEPTSSDENFAGGAQDDGLLGGDNNGNMTVDFGFANFELGSVGDFAFLDTNGNGFFDAGDTPVEGAFFELLDSSGNAIPGFSTTSAADGSYAIGSIPSGTFSVRVTAPAGSDLVLVAPGSGSDFTLDSNFSGANTATGVTTAFTIEPPQSRLALDAGFRLSQGAIPTFDFGDAPDTYLTLQSSQGARHQILRTLRLGASTDAETTGSPGVNANGDGSDENGVTFPNGTTIANNSRSFTANVLATVPQGQLATEAFQTSGYSGGINFTGNWTEGADNNNPASGNIFLDVVRDASGNPTGDQFLSFSSQAGDTRSRTLTRTVDFGSSALGPARISFRYFLQDIEANENLRVEVSRGPGQPFTIITQTPQGTAPGFTGTLTNFAGLGASIPENLLTPTTQIRFRMTPNTATSGSDLDVISIDNVRIETPSTDNCQLIAWVDFDRSGTFDAFEAQVVSGNALNGNGTTPIPVTWTIPDGIITSTGPTYARFRLSCDPDLNINRPGGTVDSGEVEDYRLNISLPFNPATIGNIIFHDRNNNGFRNAGDEGIGGILVTLTNVETGSTRTTTTAGSGGTLGSYTFGNVTPGTYKVSFTPPATLPLASTTVDTVDNRQDNDSNGAQTAGAGSMIMSPNIVLSDGETDNTVDFGLLAPGSLGNLVFNDINNDGIRQPSEPAIAGATVQLLNGAGNPIPSVPTLTTTADTNQNYLFTNLTPANYRVRVTAPSGFVITRRDQGSNNAIDSDFSGVGTPAGSTNAIALSSGQNDLTQDAGVFQGASLGNQVFVDTNGNGIRDNGEPPLNNAVVQLFQGNTQIGSDIVVGTNGVYNFTDVPAGTYRVKVTAPTGTNFRVTRPGTAGTNNTNQLDGFGTNMGFTQTVTVTGGDNVQVLDAGFYQPATLGNLVFNDINNDGIRQPSEPAIAGATVQLLNGAGNPIPSVPTLTTTTDTNQNYLFTNLIPGNYGVRVTAPSGFVITLRDQGSNNAVDSDFSGVGTPAGSTNTIALSSGQNDLTQDAGVFQGASLGNQVFVDTNGNGIRDNGEPPLDNAIVQLFQGNTQIGSDIVVGTNGVYNFTDVPAGNYRVKVTAPTGTNFRVTNPGTAGTNNTNQLDGFGTNMGFTQTVMVTGGDNVQFLDAGFYQPATLGNLVFNDINNDGIRQRTEPAIAGALVELLDDSGTPVSGVPSQTTAASGNQNYLFRNLAPDTYRVRITAPNGFVITRQNAGTNADLDSDVDGTGTTTGTTADIALVSNQDDRTRDAGLVQPATIGNFVFFDRDNDGIFNDGDTPLQSVTVDLIDSSGVTIATQLTGTDGRPAGTYLFENIPADTYSVKFTAPRAASGENFSVTASGPAGTNNTNQITSNGTAMGIATDIEVAPGESLLTIDAGFTLSSQLVAVGSTVFADLDNDGLFSSGESGIGGVVIELFDASDSAFANPVRTVTTATAANSATNTEVGDYFIDGIPAGNYVLRIPTPPTALSLSSTTDGTGSRTDNDDNGIQSNDGGVTISAPFTLTIGREPTNPAESGQGANLDGNGSIADRNGNTTLDFGFVDPSTLGSIGNFVFLDLNGNGSRDADEEGISGLQVMLLDSDGAMVGEAITTDSDGNYLFENVLAGSYSVKVTPNASAPNASSPDSAGSTAGGNDNNNGEQIVSGAPAQSPLLNVPANGENLTVDFGFVPSFAIGNLVFIDTNSDGAFTRNVDTPVGNVRLSLFSASDLTSEIAFRTTNPDGRYLFDDLLADEYIIRVDSENFRSTGPLTNSAGPLNATTGNAGDNAIDDNLSQNARLSSDPAIAGVFSDVITLGPTLSSEPTAETGIDGNSDAARDGLVDLTVDFGFVVTDVSPQGCFYLSSTGEIIEGGSIVVIAPDGSRSDGSGSASVIVTQDGSDGCFSWTTTGLPGVYCVEYTAPNGFMIDPSRPVEGFDARTAPAGTIYDPSPGGTVNPASLSANGSQRIGSLDTSDDSLSQLDDASASANTYFEKFTLESGDPMIVAVNVPLVRTNTFETFVANQGPDFPADGTPGASPAGNPDGDAFSNLLEYGLGLNPSSGLKSFANSDASNAGFITEVVGPIGAQTIDASYSRPADASDLTYVTELYSEETETWTAVTFDETVTAGPNGTEKVTLTNLTASGSPLAGESAAILRLRVTLEGGASAATGPAGFLLHTVNPVCETVSSPFVKNCLFTGTIPADFSGGLTVDFSDSLDTGDSFTDLLSSGSYYAEVVSGTREGELLDISSVTATSITFANDTNIFTGPVHSTHQGPLGSDFAGGLLIIREHMIITDLAPPAPFNAGNGVSNASQLLILNTESQAMDTYFLSSFAGTRRWLPANGGSSINSEIIPPTQAIFTHNRGSAGLEPFTLAFAGEVRTTKLNVPLQPGPNFIGSLYPVLQTPVTRGMTAADGFSGGSISARADGIAVWQADSAVAAPDGSFPEVFDFDGFFLLTVSGLGQWNSSAPRDFTNRDDEALFETDRGTFVTILPERANLRNTENYFVPTQIITEE